MKIRDILRERNTGISFEFFPPKSVEGKEGFMKLAKPDEMKKLGIELTAEQCEDLLRNGVRYLHFYNNEQSGRSGRDTESIAPQQWVNIPQPCGAFFNPLFRKRSGKLPAAQFFRLFSMASKLLFYIPP